LAKLIFAPYFTKNIGFHQHDSSNNGKGGAKPDNYPLISGWVETNLKYSRLEPEFGSVIFHNECSQKFITDHSNTCISFCEWGKSHRPSYNDERFYAYRKYLLKHPEVSHVFCTDLFDVILLGNPFQLIEQKPEYDLFIGDEKMSKYSSKWMVRKCREMKLPLIKNKYTPGETIYNAGIVGGSREKMLELFERMIDKFSRIPEKFNANMPVFNLCVEEMGCKVFSGYPLNNPFRTKKWEPGTYIKHK